jgi:vesicle coat complex subunit
MLQYRSSISIVAISSVVLSTVVSPSVATAVVVVTAVSIVSDYLMCSACITIAAATYIIQWRTTHEWQNTLTIHRYESIIGTLCENLDTLDEPEAKASIIWIIGEYAERIDNADEQLDHFLETFEEEVRIKKEQLFHL